MIHWDQISWEAFASFFTGVLAVSGAIFIGRKQTKIQESQVRLLETQIRISLFEERKQCFENMRRVHSNWMQNGMLTAEEWIEFRDVFLQSELIFTKALATDIEVTMTSAFWQRRHLARSNELYERGQEEESQSYISKSFEEDDKVFKAMPRLLAKMKSEARVTDWFDSEI